MARASGNRKETVEMTEREKMLQGVLYDANYDEELLEERIRCKDLCFAYNQLRPSLVDE